MNLFQNQAVLGEENVFDLPFQIGELPQLSFVPFALRLSYLRTCTILTKLEGLVLSKNTLK